MIMRHARGRWCKWRCANELWQWHGMERCPDWGLGSAYKLYNTVAPHREVAGTCAALRAVGTPSSLTETAPTEPALAATAAHAPVSCCPSASPENPGPARLLAPPARLRSPQSPLTPQIGGGGTLSPGRDTGPCAGPPRTRKTCPSPAGPLTEGSIAAQTDGDPSAASRFAAAPRSNGLPPTRPRCTPRLDRAALAYVSMDVWRGREGGGDEAARDDHSTRHPRAWFVATR